MHHILMLYKCNILPHIHFGLHMSEFGFPRHQILRHWSLYQVWSLTVSCSHKRGIILGKALSFCQGQFLEKDLAASSQWLTPSVTWRISPSVLKEGHMGAIQHHLPFSPCFGLFPMSINQVPFFFCECPPHLILTQSQFCPWFLQY